MEQRRDGLVRITLKKAYADGTIAVDMTRCRCSAGWLPACPHRTCTPSATRACWHRRARGDGAWRRKRPPKAPPRATSLLFFKALLKEGRDPGLPEASVFETGRNQWRSLDAWPPRTARPRAFYLNAEGKLSNEPPAEDGFDEYVSDPRKPVPFSEDVSIGMTSEYMTDDQRFAARRPDVLAYEGEVLDEDLTIAGPIQASLFVSTSGTDSDFIVKLIDVYPNDAPDPNDRGKEKEGTDTRGGPTYTRMGGYQQLVRGEPMRGKFRRSFESPEPFAPNLPANVEFVMPDVFHTFRRGHRVMVQVQSTWFPLVNLNPQTFTDINAATEAAFQKAPERVYRGKGRASAVTVQVLPSPD